ncbi:hypothetical protein NMG60_11027966 [Bertholletia excelsa]
MAVLQLTMAQSKKSNNASNTADEVKPTAIFHDFLGSSCASDSSPAAAKLAAADTGVDARPSEASPSASASVGASSGGGRGPISASSDLGSERQAGNHFEGVPFYGPRSDLTGSEMSHRLAGNKRSNSDSAFMESSRDGLTQGRPDSFDSLHLMKTFRNVGGERPRRPTEEAMVFGMNPMRLTPTSLVIQPPVGSRMDASVSKWERAIQMQYPPRVGQVASFGCQVPSNRFKDANAGPSVISQAAADEGSRTGIKGSGILSSINVGSGVTERNPSGLLLSVGKPRSGNHSLEPESSTPPSRHGSASASRQMTIFYGGQAHVFDDVHPNKADVIMALAGSNGGSWSTTYASKSAGPVMGENYIPAGENDTSIACNFASSREVQRRLSIIKTSSHGFGSGDQISVIPGGHQGASMKDGKVSVPVPEITRSEEKRGL